jgi:hypothetical protein
VTMCQFNLNLYFRFRFLGSSLLLLDNDTFEISVSKRFEGVQIRYNDDAIFQPSGGVGPHSSSHPFKFTLISPSIEATATELNGMQANR